MNPADGFVIYLNKETVKTDYGKLILLAIASFGTALLLGQGFIEVPDWRWLLPAAGIGTICASISSQRFQQLVLGTIIALTALVTSIVHCFLFPHVGLCGASGVVFAFILLTSFTSFKDGELPVTVILVALIYIGKQVYEGIAVQDNISNLAHIIGGIVGAVIGYRWNKK